MTKKLLFLNDYTPDLIESAASILERFTNLAMPTRNMASC